MSALGELGNDANRPTWAPSRRSCDPARMSAAPLKRTSTGRTRRTEKGAGRGKTLGVVSCRHDAEAGMKRFVEGEDRRQTTLLPDCIDDYVSEENPVRV